MKLLLKWCEVVRGLFNRATARGATEVKTQDAVPDAPPTPALGILAFYNAQLTAAREEEEPPPGWPQPPCSTPPPAVKESQPAAPRYKSMAERLRRERARASDL
jgi:hypothetical protein